MLVSPSQAGEKRFNRFAGKSLASSFAAAALLVCAAAPAQYAYDPSNADEQGPPGIRYFGSAKDDAGAFIPGATILLDSAQTSFVFVTDDQGRFRGTLPLNAVPGSILPKCWKAGFTFVRINKRLGPQGVKPTVQVDCILHSATAKRE